MQANPRSLDTLFNSQLRYVVPMFQRLTISAQHLAVGDYLKSQTGADGLGVLL